MSIYKGAFTETAIQNVRTRIEALRFNDRVMKQYEPQIDSASMILSNANSILNSDINQKGKFKDLTVEVEWVNACELADQACTNCDEGGNELSTNTKTYALDLCREVPFTVKEYDMLTNDFDVEDLIAKGFLKADKELSEWLIQQWIAFFNTNKGVNLTTADPGTARGCISGYDTYIKAPYWNAELMGYFAKVQQLNRFSSPFLLSGANLFENSVVANFNAGNADGKGDAAMFGAYPITFDIPNVDTVNTPNLITYMIQPGSYAIANKAYYNPEPITYDFGKRWSIRSQFLPGFEYDVHYSNVCENDFANHKFKVKLKSGIFINPEACDNNNTGILTFVCGDCPS
jgi:hypothetical protein